MHYHSKSPRTGRFVNIADSRYNHEKKSQVFEAAIPCRKRGKPSDGKTVQPNNFLGVYVYNACPMS